MARAVAEIAEFGDFPSGKRGSASGGSERLRVGDDGASIVAMQVIGVHGRTENFAVWAHALLEHIFHLLVGKAWKAGERRRLVRPVQDGSDGLDPDGSATEPSLGFEIAGGVARRVTLRAAGDLIDQVFAASDFIRGRLRAQKAGAKRPSTSNQGEKEKAKVQR